MSAPVVRLAVPDDARAIAEVHVASWRKAYDGIVPAAILDGLSVDRRAEFWRGILGAPGETRVWVVEQPDVIAGFASSGPARDGDLGPRSGEVGAIYLHPSAWALGLGRVLFTRTVSDLVERGFDPLVLWVLADNTRGRAFYERMGWRPDGSSRALDFDGTPIEEVRYRAADTG